MWISDVIPLTVLYQAILLPFSNRGRAKVSLEGVGGGVAGKWLPCDPLNFIQEQSVVYITSFTVLFVCAFVTARIQRKKNHFSLKSQWCNLSLCFLLTRFWGLTTIWWVFLSMQIQPLVFTHACSSLLKFEFPHPVLSGWFLSSYLCSRPTSGVISSPKPSLTWRSDLEGVVACFAFLVLILITVE